MTVQTIFAPSPLRTALVAHLRLGTAVRTLRQVWHEAKRAASSRHNLQHLDDRMLSDIGVSRAQAEFEASRWR